MILIYLNLPKYYSVGDLECLSVSVYSNTVFSPARRPNLGSYGLLYTLNYIKNSDINQDQK